MLLRNYTQNIDMLEHKAGIPEDKIVESHGSFSKVYCIDHKHICDLNLFWDEISKEKVPKCPQCNSTIRPDIVFFGESLPSRYVDLRLNDLRNWYFFIFFFIIFL